MSDKYLPKTSTKPSINPLLSRLLIYGQSGTGRTFFSAEFPAVYFDLAQTAQYYEIKRYPPHPPDGWKPPKKKADAWRWFLHGIDLCIREASSDVLVIDTIDQAFQFCFESVCGDYGVESPEDNMRHLRQIYGQINREFGRMLSRLRLFPGGLIIVSGEEVICRDRAGATVDPSLTESIASRRAEPSFKAKSTNKHKLRASLEELCGVIGRAVIADNGDRLLVISAPDSMGKDRTGILPAVMPLTYEGFCAPFRAAYKAKKDKSK